MTTLGALLLNPPVAGGARTMRHLRVAADLLGCDRVEIANLFSIATCDVTAINEVGRSGDGWAAARPQLHQAIAASDYLLAGWGVSGLAGQTAAHQRTQVDYVKACAREFGKDYIWTLRDEPRHPSRWHQYVSDRHERTSGASLSERMAMVLESVLLATLRPEGGRREEVIACPQPAPSADSAAN